MGSFKWPAGDVWNIYKEGSTPIPWKFIEDKRIGREHIEYLKARTIASIAIGRNRDWRGCHMSLATKIWRFKCLSKSTRARVVKILYDQYWHGGNRSKGVNESEAITLKKCDLCGDEDSQCHMVMECKHPSMVFARQQFQNIIHGYHNRLLRDYKAQKYELARMIHSVWLKFSTETEAIWIGRWNQEQVKMIQDNIHQIWRSHREVL